ncbi:MAG: type III pantothenate kinase [Bacilli bacterium]
MIMLLDLSNVSINIAVYQQKKKLFSFRIFSDKLKSQSEYESTISNFLKSCNLSKNEIEGAILSSVVPSLTNRIKNAVSNIISKECLVVSKNLKTGLAIRTDNPNEVGSDMISTSIGAIDDYQENCLVIALSSVLTFSLVSEKREFLGCSFFPGLLSASSQMISDSALLTDIEFSHPKKYLGKSTKESINSGVLFGYTSLIETMSERIETEFGKPLKKIVTGKDSRLVFSLLKDGFTYNSDLIFDGLYNIYIKNN